MNAAGLAAIGLRHQHYQAILAALPPMAWMEVHPENYFGEGGLPHHYLQQIRQHYDLSFHGIGMSLGSEGPVDMAHLKRLKELISIYAPVRVSEHLSFSLAGQRHVHDLLPMLYSPASLQRFCDKLNQAQDYLGCQLLIENPSSYLSYKESTLSEWEFFASLPQRTGCGLLLDINNVYVSCANLGYDAQTYLHSIKPAWVGEYHLAGHSAKQLDEGRILIDDHGSKVIDAVWQLYDDALATIGPKPTLIEWDTNIPELDVLVAQQRLAQQRMEAL